MKWLVALLIWTMTTAANAETVRLAVTTSFHNSGLSDVLLPAIAKDIGVEVQLLVVGTGQALKLARAGDVDAVLVHSRAAEDAFVADGYAPHRRDVMFNDFVVIGPRADPANLREASDISDALARISGAGTFLSRGDDSGTHRRELSLWMAAKIKPARAFYREAGSGMGATLNTAVGLGAHTLSDRASWVNFANKRDHDILFEGDAALENQYGFLPVSSERHPHVRSAAVRTLEDWLTGLRGQSLIDAYRVNGQKLFTANARRAD